MPPAVRRALRAALPLVALMLGAQPAGAGDVYLRVSDGRVTLLADAASLREILQEWVRVTGAEVVNAEKLRSTPITLRLVDVPERTALATLLRDAGGYILGSRPASDGLPAEIHLPGRVDRILILGIPPATGTAAARTTPPARPQSLADMVTATLPDLGHTQAAEGNTEPQVQSEPPVAAPPSPMSRTPGFVPQSATTSPDVQSAQTEPASAPRRPSRSRSESASSRGGSSRPGTITPVPPPPPPSPPQIPGMAIPSGGERIGESGIPPE